MSPLQRRRGDPSLAASFDRLSRSFHGRFRGPCPHSAERGPPRHSLDVTAKGSAAETCARVTNVRQPPLALNTQVARGEDQSRDVAGPHAS
ncbi:hypothetical protein SKAU_G00242020 [Synaphobranchus kaupii]|uniref:Uncharacterized protein n=1 Tax=Synaphobranchus kaupii TaxID=118154 RepID=A0A9Q1F7Q2_SYNKA|nr:hypothetical protein SKAU_G00242020 [Synaphobranchus kaupii]